MCFDGILENANLEILKRLMRGGQRTGKHHLPTIELWLSQKKGVMPLVANLGTNENQPFNSKNK